MQFARGTLAALALLLVAAPAIGSPRTVRGRAIRVAFAPQAGGSAAATWHLLRAAEGHDVFAHAAASDGPRGGRLRPGPPARFGWIAGAMLLLSADAAKAATAPSDLMVELELNGGGTYVSIPALRMTASLLGPPRPQTPLPAGSVIADLL